MGRIPLRLSPDRGSMTLRLWIVRRCRSMPPSKLAQPGRLQAMTLGCPLRRGPMATRACASAPCPTSTRAFPRTPTPTRRRPIAMTGRRRAKHLLPPESRMLRLERRKKTPRPPGRQRNRRAQRRSLFAADGALVPKGSNAATGTAVHAFARAKPARFSAARPLCRSAPPAGPTPAT